jgi:hypothetical protein
MSQENRGYSRVYIHELVQNGKLKEGDIVNLTYTDDTKVFGLFEEFVPPMRFFNKWFGSEGKLRIGTYEGYGVVIDSHSYPVKGIINFKIIKKPDMEGLEQKVADN